MSRKAQVWTADFIIALALFLIVAITSISLIINANPSDKYDELYKDTVHLSGQLMSQGHPHEWDEDSVVIPGLLENKTRLSTTKLEEYNKLNYNNTKNLLQTRHDYFFYFNDGRETLNITQCNYGYEIETDAECNPALESLNYDNLVRIERILIHDSKLVKMVIYSWN